jgi:hypothetical protein
VNLVFSSLTGLALVFAVLLPSSVRAHDTWLSAEQTVVGAGQTLRLNITSGEAFPVPGTAIAPDRIELASCMQGSARFELKAGRRQAKVLELRATPPAAGGVSCIVRLAPRKLDLDVGKVQHYLDEIDAPSTVREAWKASPEPKRWMEIYSKNAQVIVPGRSGRDGTAPGLPSGLTLGFFTDQALAQGSVSGPLGVTLLRDGKPLAGVSVNLSAHAGGQPQRQRSDQNGRVSFAQPAPGKWMLSATDLRLVDAGQSRWESQFATLVFEVLPPGR